MPLSKNELKDMKSIGTKKGRKAQKSFMAEGVRVMEEAVRHRIRPDLVVWAPSATNARGQKLIKDLQVAGVPCEELSVKELEAVAQAKSPQPVIGRFPIQNHSAGQLLDQKTRKVLLCDGISDPGNLGTLIRSALAFGFDRLLLVGNSADPYNPKVVRSSAGSIFGIKAARTESAELKTILSATEFMVVGSSIHQGNNPATPVTKLAGKQLILAIGSEAEGLSESIGELCDQFIKLDHSPGVESLNAAVAGSIMMKQFYDLEK